jgi:N-acetyl-D-muramate 6-phosphate phosphatase
MNYPSIEKEKIKVLIFDIDGTLRDTDDELVRKIEVFLLNFQFAVSSEKTKTAARKLVMQIEDPGQKFLYYSDKWGWDYLLHKIIRCIRFLLKPFKQKTNYSTIQGVKEMIPLLAEKYTLAVCSAGDEETVTNFLKSAGIASYFKVIATALTCRYTKPFPDPLIWIANELNTKLEHCIMIGDTTVDIKAGINAGTTTIAVLCGFGEKKELENLNPNLLLNSTYEVQEYV